MDLAPAVTAPLGVAGMSDVAALDEILKRFIELVHRSDEVAGGFLGEPLGLLVDGHDACISLSPWKNVLATSTTVFCDTPSVRPVCAIPITYSTAAFMHACDSML